MFSFFNKKFVLQNFQYVHIEMYNKLLMMYYIFNYNYYTVHINMTLKMDIYRDTVHVHL
jgi:hypothetical protein